jgi:RES domain-containing protein
MADGWHRPIGNSESRAPAERPWSRNIERSEALDSPGRSAHGRSILHQRATNGEVQVAAHKETVSNNESETSGTHVCVSSDRGKEMMAAQSPDQIEKALDSCAKVIANVDEALEKRAECAGATPGLVLAPEAADDALSLIARSARDLFKTIENALRYLDRENFAGTGLSTRELLARGRGTSVIARLDELRFGSRGWEGSLGVKIVDLKPTVLFRVTSPEFYRMGLSPEGSRKVAGRFNPIGRSALYLSFDYPTALTEYYGTEPPVPAVVLPVDLKKANRVIEITDKVGNWPACWRDWQCDWEFARDQILAKVPGAHCSSWECGEDTLYRNCCGIVFPSTKRSGGRNLVLFTESAVQTLFSYEMIDPHDSIGKANPVRKRK